jgi:2-keto-4-pentenoate hydratase/2-oxohepta-3-ene-1,7-dioic acid hydratase in catechol pathway
VYNQETVRPRESYCCFYIANQTCIFDSEQQLVKDDVVWSQKIEKLKHEIELALAVEFIK